MKLSAGIGLAALIVTIIALFIPIVGLFITWLALIIAAIAAFMGDKGLTIATIVLSAVKFVITPTMWAAGMVAILPSAIFWALPIIGMIYSSRKTAAVE